MRRSWLILSGLFIALPGPGCAVPRGGGALDSGRGPDTGEDGDAIELSYPAPSFVEGADVRILGDQEDMDLGRAMRVGDVTGDGVNDLVGGTVYLHSRRGGAVVLPGPLHTSGDAGELGLSIPGPTAFGSAGRSVSLADLDGDGYLDVGLGTPGASPSGMRLSFGPVVWDAVMAAGGVMLEGPDDSYAGEGSDLGDVDGDGVADAVVGAWALGDNAGVTYVIYGPVADGVDLAGVAGATLTGAYADASCGSTLRAGADLDGDGVGDLVISCKGSVHISTAGEVIVVLGPVEGEVDVADGDGHYIGDNPDSSAGLSLDAGDVDGDGLSDVVAAAMDSTLAADSGAAFVVAGPASERADLAAADIVVRGAVENQSGGGVALADLDLDGTAELMLGAALDPTVAIAAGAAFVFFDPAPGAYVFEDGDADFYTETERGTLGAGLVGGDVTDDGVPDVILGAPWSSYLSGDTYHAGAIYVMSGG